MVLRLAITVRHSQSTSGQMPRGSANRMDDYSTDSEDGVQIENQQFIDIQHDVKIPTRKEARTARVQFLALCWSLFLLGWISGSTGPLLPSIQESYDVGFETVSWIFVLGNSGAVLGALLNMPLIDRFGLGKILVVGSLFQIAACLVQFLQLSFPLFVLSFGLCGIGMTFQDASANGFIATLQNDSGYKMGFMHAAFGIGALTAPLSATQFAQLTHWSCHYLVSFSLSVLNVVILARVFRFQAQDECLRQAGEAPFKTQEIYENKFVQLINNKTVHFLALFTTVYGGVEVTITGWIVTFMIIVRGGGPSSGYISTGFYGGLTLGRVVLVEVTKKVGDIYAIYIYILLAIFFQLVVWLLPSFTVSAISVCIIGILLGPIYPITMKHIARVLPGHLVNGTIGWTSACGAAGIALLSLLTGSMASKWGIEILQPLLIAMMIIVCILWSFVPKKLL